MWTTPCWNLWGGGTRWVGPTPAAPGARQAVLGLLSCPNIYPCLGWSMGWVVKDHLLPGVALYIFPTKLSHRLELIYFATRLQALCQVRPRLQVLTYRSHLGGALNGDWCSARLV